MPQLFLSFLVLLSLTTYAQDSTISYKHCYVLKLDPSALIDPDRTIQAGLEFPIGPRTSWQTVVGYGWKGLVSSEYVDDEVWRIRNEVRFYTGRFRTNKARNIAIKSLPPLGNYWAVELLTKQINVTDTEYQLVDGGPASSAKPEVIGPLPKQRYVIGSHIKIGRQFAVPYTKETLSRVLLDFFVGVGVRYAVVQQQSTQPQYDPMDYGMFRDRFQPGNRFAPSFVGGLKMGFGL